MSFDLVLPFHALQMRPGQPIISGIYSPSASLIPLFFSLFKYPECHLQHMQTGSRLEPQR